MNIKFIIYFLCKDRDATPNGPSKRFSITAYNRVIKKIMDSHGPTENLTPIKITNLKLTNYMQTKIIKFLKRKIPKNAEAKILKTTLSNITGVGAKKADVLIEAGLKNVRQIKLKKYQALLNTDSKIDTRHKPEKKISHDVIKKIEPVLTQFPNAILVGSYRRKKSFSRDVDIMIVSKSKNALKSYLIFLKKHFTVHPYSEGKEKMSVLLGIGKKYIKADIFRTIPSSKYAMLLYSTGSKFFNIRMRARAKKLGMLLNQNGLFKDGKKIDVRSEKGFFTKLQLKYVEPDKR